MLSNVIRPRFPRLVDERSFLLNDPRKLGLLEPGQGLQFPISYGMG